MQKDDISENSIKGDFPNVSQWFYKYLFSFICAVSLICYIIFSQGFRYLLKDFNYLLTLFNILFPNGFMNGITQHTPLLPSFNSFYEGLLLFAFVIICALCGWLIHSLSGGRRTDMGPNIILFSFAAAIVPTLLSAVVLWPDGRGYLTLETAFWSDRKSVV